MPNSSHRAGCRCRCKPLLYPVLRFSGVAPGRHRHGPAFFSVIRSPPFLLPNDRGSGSQLQATQPARPGSSARYDRAVRDLETDRSNGATISAFEKYPATPPPAWQKARAPRAPMRLFALSCSSPQANADSGRKFRGKLSFSSCDLRGVEYRRVRTRLVPRCGSGFFHHILHSRN